MVAEHARPCTTDVVSRDAAVVSEARAAELMRLGVLMAITMTLHNAPEGFAVGVTLGPLHAQATAFVGRTRPCRLPCMPSAARKMLTSARALLSGMQVAFASFTDFGGIMALAIAVHNIPEGVIVAAPVYAATGSRWAAVGIALASVRQPC